MRYQLCDLTIDSELPLVELEPAGGDDGQDLSLRYGPAVTQSSEDYDWFHEWRYPDGELWNSFARVGSGYLCRFAGIADFHIANGGEAITCSPVAGIPENTLGNIFLNQVIPIVLSASGERLVLHASAVAIDGRAVGFLGETGQGKSTLAGSFCRAGYPLVTDDFLVIQKPELRPWVLPTYAGLRLWDDTAPAVAAAAADAPTVAHFTDKKRISLREYELPFCANPVPLGRFYLLGNDLAAGSAIGIEAIAAREAMLELTRYSFHLDLSAGAVRRAEFAGLGQLAGSTPVYRLSYPRQLGEVPAVHAAILKHLRAS